MPLHGWLVIALSAYLIIGFIYAYNIVMHDDSDYRTIGGDIYCFVFFTVFCLIAFLYDWQDRKHQKKKQPRPHES